MRVLGSFLVTSLLLAACTDAGPEDGEHDEFTSADGKADGYDLSEAQALAVMKVAATKSEAELRAAGVSARAAKNIATYAKTQKFDSLAELDGIAYVGPRTLDALLEAAGPVDDNTLGRHDVSILVPLPAAGGDLPWKASMPGQGGAILPKTVFAQIGLSVFREIDDAAEYDALRVVGVRVDPCFTTSLVSACQPQIRLVFQTLNATQGTNDGAVHALYNLSATDFAEVVDALRAFTDVAPQSRAYAPLGINPALRVQGMAGPYARDLGQLIADYVGPANLSRMTFVTRTAARQGQWELGGFHVKAFPATGFPAPGPIKIVGDETLQILGNPGFGVPRFGVTPAPIDPVAATGLDTSAIPTLSATAKTKLNAWALKQELPALSVPDTTDCASCHIAGHISNALEAADVKFATLDRGPRVIGGAERQGDNLRAFGYFGKEPMVSIRTANETAAVLRALQP